MTAAAVIAVATEWRRNGRRVAICTCGLSKGDALTVLLFERAWWRWAQVPVAKTVWS